MSTSIESAIRRQSTRYVVMIDETPRLQFFITLDSDAFIKKMFDELYVWMTQQKALQQVLMCYTFVVFI